MTSSTTRSVSSKEAITATTRALARNHELKISFGETRDADVFLPPLDDNSPPEQRDFVRGEAERPIIAEYYQRCFNKNL